MAYLRTSHDGDLVDVNGIRKSIGSSGDDDRRFLPGVCVPHLQLASMCMTVNTPIQLFQICKSDVKSMFQDYPDEE